MWENIDKIEIDGMGIQVKIEFDGMCILEWTN